MKEQSSRFPTDDGSRDRASSHGRRAAAVAATFGIAVFGIGAGFAVSGCGSDNNSKSISNAINSASSQAQSVLSQASTAVTGAQQQAQSVQSQVQSIQSQAQSIQTQIQQKTNGGGQ